MPTPTLPGAGAKPQAKVVKQRYFKGKPTGTVESESESEGEEPVLEIKRNAGVPKLEPGMVAGGAGRVLMTDKIKMDLGKVKLDGGVKHEIGEESEEESDDEAMPPPAFVKPPPSDEESEYETESESESEEEKPAFRPVFVGKGARKTVTAEQAAKEAEEAEKRAEEERERRKLDSKELAGETIRRELIEKEAGTEMIPDVDDTDGLDPEAEFDAWRARELARLLRDKTAQAQADAEREEIERRRAMPEDVRMAEDMEYAEATRNREKGEMGFLQKYYHKGAFHQDDDDEIFTRDYTAATESAVDVSMLPKVLQVRQGDFGKASRSKYTHLSAEDTSVGGWGTGHQQFARPGNIGTTETGCWNCGGPHMRADCPNDNINDPNVVDGVLVPGAGGFGGRGGPPGRGGFAGRGGRGGPPGRGGSFGTAANNAPLGSGSRWVAGESNGDRNGGERKRPREEEGDERRSKARDDRGGRERDERRGGDRRDDRDRDGRRDRDRVDDRRDDRRDDRHRDGRDRRDRDRDDRRRDQRSRSPRRR